MNFIYPQDLKAKPNMWMWDLKDFAIMGIGALISVVLLIHFHAVIPLGIVAVFAFETIRLDDTTVMDYIRYCKTRITYSFHIRRVSAILLKTSATN